MNGKAPLTPIFGELIQIAAGATILITIVALALQRHIGAAALLAVGLVAYFVGRRLRRPF